MARNYDQYCALAAALDAVGDRWSLLVVRELLGGPRRYGDLLDGVPGVSTDILAARLRHLQAEGLVAQEADESDGRAKTYRLTEQGRDLEEGLLALTRFGLRRLGTEDNDQPFRLSWLGLAVRALYRPGSIDRDLRVRFVLDADTWQVRLTPDDVVDDQTGEPDVTVEGRPNALLTAIRNPRSVRTLVGTGALHVSGRATDLTRFRNALRGLG